MTEETIRETVADRITHYRRTCGMTQWELSEKINYSDKSISKWERGEGLPDVLTLVRLSEIFGVTIDDLLYPENAEKSKTQPESVQSVQSTHSRFTWAHYFITLLSVGGIWAAVLLTICMFRFLAPEIAAVWDNRILCYGIPACSTVWLVLSILWWPYAWRFVCITGMIWGGAVSVHITFPMPGIGTVYAAAGVLQLLLTVCYLWKCAAERRWIKPIPFPEKAIRHTTGHSEQD